MKSPVRLTQPENEVINAYADKELLKNSSQNKPKVISVKINDSLYENLLAESDDKRIVMAELIREAIEDLIESPNQSYSAELMENNSKGISFKIDLKMNRKMEDFKASHGINKSNQIRQALSARYVNT